MQKISIKLEYKIRELLKTIQEYESDTFSSTGSQLSLTEAIQLTDQILRDSIENLIDHKLDGVMLEEYLADLRKEK